jgi:NitT/TauT family transport system permease protein
MKDNRQYFFPHKPEAWRPNPWDFIIFFIIFAIFFALAKVGSDMNTPYEVGETLAITLDPRALPEYGIRTVIRMFIAMFFSLLFALGIGTLAAKYKRAERVIIPAIDILQSVPILGFLSITIVGFIWLFPGSLLGPEFAAIFAIFTSQAWNMMLSVYQSLKTVPDDLREASKMFHLSSWQNFWRVDIPFAMPSLLWNTMMSMSGGWFFLVAAEAISVSNQEIMLPGIGSYIAMAIEQANLLAVGYAIVAMLIIILLYDQLLFRPLIKWSDKFKAEQAAYDETSRSWVLSLLRRGRFFRIIGAGFGRAIDATINCRWFMKKPEFMPKQILPKQLQVPEKALNLFWDLLIYAVAIGSLIMFTMFILRNLTVGEVLHVFYLGAITAIRIVALIIIASLIWVPIGVWVGMRPRVAQVIQPLAQFLAAFPANLLFPLVVLVIVKYSLNIEIWTTPLMILGTQWYILFNVIAGASSLPKDLYHAAQNFGLKNWLWWKRLALPAIFPYYITGALTAAGGAWNASIVAEIVFWGDITLVATGLGAYIHEVTETGDFPRIALGIGVMCIYVIAFNRLVWQRMYNYAEARYRVN